VNGRLPVFGRAGGIPPPRFAEFEISWVRFGPGTLGLILAALQRAAETPVALGE